MLDERTATLLHRVNELCREGKYEIIEEGELLSGFAPRAGMDTDNLKKTVEFLAERGYIDVKYAENGTYCMCPLPDGRQYSERVRAQRSDVLRRRRDMVLTTALGAFVGGFLGSLLAWLVSALS